MSLPDEWESGDGGELLAARDVLSRVLVQRAGEHSNFTVLCGDDIGSAAAFSQTWPERLITVPPLETRLAMAEGVSRAGGEAVVILEGGIDQLPVPVDVGVVMLSLSDEHLHLAFRAGVHVVQPAWVPDVTRLLHGSLRAGHSTLLRSPDLLGSRDGAPPAATFGAHRMFHRGGNGLVIGAGGTAPVCREVGTLLARADIGVTTMDLHTVTPGSGVDASLLPDHLLVGPLDTPRAAAMTAIPVSGTVSDLARRVRDVLGVTPDRATVR